MAYNSRQNNEPRPFTTMRASIYGNLTADPYFRPGDEESRDFASFDVACNYVTSVKGEDGQYRPKEGVDYIHVTVWGRNARAVRDTLTKGTRVSASGTLWPSFYYKDGQEIRKNELRADPIPNSITVLPRENRDSYVGARGSEDSRDDFEDEPRSARSSRSRREVEEDDPRSSRSSRSSRARDDFEDEPRSARSSRSRREAEEDPITDELDVDTRSARRSADYIQKM